jgi:hypothetical protein
VSRRHPDETQACRDLCEVEEALGVADVVEGVPVVILAQRGGTARQSGIGRDRECISETVLARHMQTGPVMAVLWIVFLRVNGGAARRCRIRTPLVDVDVGGGRIVSPSY